MALFIADDGRIEVMFPPSAESDLDTEALEALQQRYDTIRDLSSSVAELGRLKAPESSDMQSTGIVSSDQQEKPKT